MHFCYGVYNSPRPAVFSRFDGHITCPLDTSPDCLPDDDLTDLPEEDLPCPIKDDRLICPVHHCFYRPVIEPPVLDADSTDPAIKIIFKDEAYRGSTGMVHFGTMHLDDNPTFGVKVAVKLAFSEKDKTLLINEWKLYQKLHEKMKEKGLDKGVPKTYGLFVDQESVEGAQGPFALVLGYSGSSLHHVFRSAKPLPKDEEEKRKEIQKREEKKCVLSSPTYPSSADFELGPSTTNNASPSWSVCMKRKSYTEIFVFLISASMTRTR